MDKHTATEVAYKNGYARGYEDGKNSVVKRGHCWLCEDYDTIVEVVCYLPNDSGGATDISIDYCPICGNKISDL